MTEGRGGSAATEGAVERERVHMDMEPRESSVFDQVAVSSLEAELCAAREEVLELRAEVSSARAAAMRGYSEAAELRRRMAQMQEQAEAGHGHDVSLKQGHGKFVWPDGSSQLAP